MTTPSRSQLVLQLDNLTHKGDLPILMAVTDAHGLPRGLWLAINSRETNCVNELGDFQGGEHRGVGMCQIDIQHPIARQARDNRSWKTPEGFKALQEFGAALLQANVHAVLQEWSQANVDEDALRVAAAGYNCGVQRALNAEDAGDCDTATTGHNYGKDVIARAAIFTELLGAQP